MLKKYIALFVAAVLTLCQSGCYDSREIDETAYIIAIGIDEAEDGEYKYTFQFAAPLAISGEGGGGGEEKKGGDSNNPGVKNTVVKAADFYVARNMLNNFLSKNIDMSHLKLIVFSEAVESDGFIVHSQLLRREREVRPHTLMAVAEKSAEGFLRGVNPELEANTAKFYELMSMRSNNVYAPSKRLHEFADELSDGGSSVLPIACITSAESSDELEKQKTDNAKDGWIESGNGRISESKAELRGMAVFKNGDIMQKMDGDSGMIYNILRRDIETFTLTIENKHRQDENITFNVRVPSAARYTVKQNDGEYTVTVQQKLMAEFAGDGLPKGYKTQKELMNDFNSVLSARIKSFMNSTAREAGADIMQTGNCLKKKSATLKEWQKHDWQNKYKKVKFKVIID